MGTNGGSQPEYLPGPGFNRAGAIQQNGFGGRVTFGVAFHRRGDFERFAGLRERFPEIAAGINPQGLMFEQWVPVSYRSSRDF